MNRRLAKVIFNQELGMSANTLIQLLQDLPNDAIVVNMGSDWNNNTFGLVVQSESYKPVPINERITEIFAKFERKDFNDPNAITCAIDDSNAVEIKENPFFLEYMCTFPTSEQQNKSTKNHIQELQHVFNKVYNDAYESPTSPVAKKKCATCNMVFYSGLTKYYNYCTVCDAKEDL